MLLVVDVGNTNIVIGLNLSLSLRPASITDVARTSTSRNEVCRSVQGSQLCKLRPSPKSNLAKAPHISLYLPISPHITKPHDNP